MSSKDTQFKPGERRSIATEFKPGQHWRKPQAFRDAAWLTREYVELQRSTGDIAKQFGVGDSAIKRVRRDPQPASRLVLRTKADAVKTARIQGTGVSA
jgi:hypothetical protein